MSIKLDKNNHVNPTSQQNDVEDHINENIDVNEIDNAQMDMQDNDNTQNENPFVQHEKPKRKMFQNKALNIVIIVCAVILVLGILATIIINAFF